MNSCVFQNFLSKKLDENIFSVSKEGTFFEVPFSDAVREEKRKERRTRKS